MRLLKKENISLFKNLTNINGGFRLPDQAYVHGSDFKCFEQLGGDLYFSNYWYGEKAKAEIFAENIAQYFKKQYKKIVPEEYRYDFYGMVLLWTQQDTALVGSINLEDSLTLGDRPSKYPEELKLAFKESGLKILLNDFNDNTPQEILYTRCSKAVKKQMINFLTEDNKQYYIETASKEGIDLS